MYAGARPISTRAFEPQHAADTTKSMPPRRLGTRSGTETLPWRNLPCGLSFSGGSPDGTEFSNRRFAPVCVGVVHWSGPIRKELLSAAAAPERVGPGRQRAEAAREKADFRWPLAIGILLGGLRKRGEGKPRPEHALLGQRGTQVKAAILEGWHCHRVPAAERSNLRAVRRRCSHGRVRRPD